MNIRLPLLILQRHPDLPKDDHPIRRLRRLDAHQILLHVELRQLLVTDPCLGRTREHRGLVLVPMVPQVDELALEVVLDVRERLDRLL